MGDSGMKRRWKLPSVGGIRKAEEESAEDEKRAGAGGGLELELTNGKELSGISHLISRATRLRDSVGSRAGEGKRTGIKRGKR